MYYIVYTLGQQLLFFIIIIMNFKNNIKKNKQHKLTYNNRRDNIDLNFN